MVADLNEQVAAKEPGPRILRVIDPAAVEEDRPLVAVDNHRPSLEGQFDA